MTLDAYLHACLKNGRTVRWPDKAMPLRLYIAPFQWYESDKRRQAQRYEQLALEAFNAWREASGGRIAFTRVQEARDSQIDVRWRRVDRRSLGHCEYLVNAHHLIYSAEISIGISDGRLHQAYNDIREAHHTILHEVGHALGLIGHSDAPGDILYVPHQYGVDTLSPRDVASIRALYQLPPGFNPPEAAERYGLPTETPLNELLAVMAGLSTPSPEARAASPQNRRIDADPAALERHHRILSEQGRFHLATQDIRLKRDLRRFTHHPLPSQPPPDVAG
ncbi:MAG: matrixin family metalloprotease [Vampirovibrionales bacterium]|nr:matrixin family metalloprotease [Vampirovibrionales bacterium]